MVKFLHIFSSLCIIWFKHKPKCGASELYQKAAKGKDYIKDLKPPFQVQGQVRLRLLSKKNYSFSISHFVLLLELVFAGLYIYLTQRLLKDKGFESCDLCN